MLVRLTCSLLLWASVAVPARADELVVFGAGSLREAIGAMARDFGAAHGVSIRTEFGPSGRMRARIEAGEHADLFTSADVGHPRKLVADGRAETMAVFVRNTICLLSPTKFGASTETLMDRLLAPGVRVGRSPAMVDPLGDYTDRLFGLMDRLRPGAGAAMEARSVVLDTPPGAPPPRSGDTDADAVVNGRVDASIVYCSGRDRYARLLPDATLVQFPPSLQIGPEYGLAVLKGASPAAYAFALAILSPEGQKSLAERGFRPVTLPSD